VFALRAMTAFPTNFQVAADAVQAAALTGDLSAANPFSAAHRRELASARDRAKGIRKAARVASFNGWTTALIAACSAPFALSDITTFAITIALSFVAFNEFRGRRRLLNFDPSAATLLGWNQLGLLAVIIVYSLWSLHTNTSDASAVSAQLQSYGDLDSALGAAGTFEGLYKTITYGVYGGVIVLSVIFQGGNALYYFSRRRHIEDFNAETPEWARDVLTTL
jgi:hypothetical protein